jgi:hypothetical protein|tara:strand:+ start:1204 stop:1563 length:360 start_codon:yes stop_codon:yes gene_type:complete
MATYNFKKDTFITNEVSGAVAQACIATFFTGGYRFHGFPRIIAIRNPSNDISERVSEKSDTFDIIMSAGDASVTLNISFADAAAHALQFRKKGTPAQRLIKLAEAAIVKLGSILSGDEL